MVKIEPMADIDQAAQSCLLRVQDVDARDQRGDDDSIKLPHALAAAATGGAEDVASPLAVRLAHRAFARTACQATLLTRGLREGGD